jgi:hypothetical protein
MTHTRQACLLRVAADPLAGGDTGALAEPVSQCFRNGVAGMGSDASKLQAHKERQT